MGDAVSIVLTSAFLAVCLFSVSTDFRKGKIYNAAFLGMLVLAAVQAAYALAYGTVPDFFAARLAGFLAMVGFVYAW